MIHLMDRLRPLFDPLLIGANDPSPYVAYGAPIVPDVLSERCALTGIHAVLTAARTEYVFIVACDLPFLNPTLIDRMMARRIVFDVVVPESNRGIEPLHSLYSRSCIGPIEETVREGSWKVTDFYRRVRVDQWRVRDEQWTVDGKSPMELMLLEGIQGAQLTLRAHGPDAEAAVTALSALVTAGFDEPP